MSFSFTGAGRRDDRGGLAKPGRDEKPRSPASRRAGAAGFRDGALDQGLVVCAA